MHKRYIPIESPLFLSCGNIFFCLIVHVTWYDEKHPIRLLTGGVRPRSPPRHDTTAPEEPFCARGSIRLSLLLYFFIMDLLTRTCLSGSSFISSLPLGFRVGSSLFGIPFVKPILLCEPFILFL